MPSMRWKKPVDPVHVPGTTRGEQLVISKGHEPGRGHRKSYRSARDSTGINAEFRQPILPSMPNIPPA